MRFKKVYIEITNSCNLNCSFCIGNKRKINNLSFNQFRIILDKIKPYTNYLYFHVLGEPLLHPDLVSFIEYASEMGFYVNITTNGYLIKRLLGVSNIRQLNISLHSFSYENGVSLDEYLSNIFSVISSFTNTYVSLRLWILNDNLILKKISEYFNVDIPSDFDKFKLSNNIFLSKFHEFIWPDINNQYYNDSGKCYGLIDHIGILSDGSIVPCCLDSKGTIVLGNVFLDSLEDVLSSSRVSSMIDGFKRGYKCEELCRHCGFFNEEN
jgi:MoaA/NifB/PqqE/SkfB family radical SAM enzyme